MLKSILPDLHVVWEAVFVQCKEEPDCLKEATDILHIILEGAGG